MILGTILNPLNSSIIAVSLVPIGRAFGVSTSRTAWLVSALYLATAIGQPVVGRLVDLFGPKPLFLAGGVFATVAGLLGAFAPDFGFLIAARVILGFGTCAAYPASMFLIRVEQRRTGLASPTGVLTALAVAGQTIMVVGPTLGGLLNGLGGWRATFAINIPLGVTSLALASAYLPGRAAVFAHRSSDGGDESLDYLGMALFAATLVALLLLLMSPDLGHLYLLAVAGAAGGALTWWQLRVRSPFLDLRLLAGNRPLLATYARNVLSQTISYVMLYGYAQWMEDSRDLGATAAGLVLMPLSAVAVAVASLTGRRPEVKRKLVVGAFTQLAGALVLFALAGGSAIWFLVVVAVIFGVPQGLNSLGNQNAVYHQAEPSRLGSSSGLLRTFTYLGAMIASAASSAFFGQTADTAGMHRIATLVVVTAAACLLLTLVDRSLSAVGRTPPDRADGGAGDRAGDRAGPAAGGRPPRSRLDRRGVT
ncbi:MAG: MFS transporter [Actinomycetia bacterium]|nr:MFS transporter [Actinomycetes bacterium]